MKALSIGAVVLACFIGQLKAQSLFDDFNDGVIDSNLWIASLPYGASRVFETNGNTVMIARGGLDTVQSFPTNLNITGRFKFTGTEDHFGVTIRSDLGTTADFKEKYGVRISFQDNSQSVRITEYTYTNIVEIAFLSYPFAGNTSYDFRITDDGNTVRLYMANASVPTIQASSSFRAGYKIAVYNREIGSCRSELDFIDINPLSPTLKIFTAIELEFLTGSGRTYQLQATPNLTNNTWTNFDSPILGDGNLWAKTYSTRGAAKLFYRVTEVQP